MSLVRPERLYEARSGTPMYALAPEPQPSPHPNLYSGTHAITFIITFLILILFFVGFLSIYFCRCFMDSLTSMLNNRARNPMGTPVNPSNTEPPGLDPSIIESFPMFEYASIKDYRPSNYGLECAICLSEFQEDDVIRLVPECYHVFHKECIDLWLASHRSCPVCRRCLDPGPVSCSVMPDSDTEARGLDDEPSCSIAVKEESESPLKRVALYGDERFSRSHSTGHSIVRMEEENKYTLRLPEHMIKGHVQALSCTTFGEMSRGTSQRRS